MIEYMTNGIFANSTTQLQDNIESISSNPYTVFKFSVRSEITRKYYEKNWFRFGEQEQHRRTL